jgi:hypothetical protein
VPVAKRNTLYILHYFACNGQRCFRNLVGPMRKQRGCQKKRSPVNGLLQKKLQLDHAYDDERLHMNIPFVKL